MAQKYYNSAETAKILGKSVDDVKKMLERRELHGYRDGADWKFKVEDIDRMASSSSPKPGAEEEGGDVLLSEVALGQSDPGLSGTVIGMSGVSPIITDSDIRLAESDIQLGEEAKTPFPKKKSDSDSKGAKFEDLNLSLEDDLTLDHSGVAIDDRPATGGSSAIELGGKESDDDELVLAGSSVGSDVTIGGDSGISLVDPSDSGLSLETPINLGAVSDGSLKLTDSDIASASGLAVAGSSSAIQDDDFTLTPLDDVAATDSSAGGSQAITFAAEGEDAATIGGSSGSMAAMLDESLTSPSTLDLGASGPLTGAPVLGGQQGGLAEGAALVQPSSAFLESSFTGLQIAGLAACTFVLTFCGMMLYDLLRNVWSWQGAYPVNSGLMDTILGWLGM